MKTYAKTFGSLFLCTGLLVSTACTKAKQDTQQGQANSTMTDARPDLSNQPSPVSTPETATTAPNANANPADDQQATTTNPNSSRNTTDSTINTSAGAAVVGDANMNPRTPTSQPGQAQAEAVPTSVDTSKDVEPKSDQAVNNANCRDAIANNYNGKTSAKTNNCPPTAESRIKDKDTSGQVAR